MLSGEELAVDKVLALFGRAEARDFVDLVALEPRYGLERLCELAVQKDLGFDPGVFADMLTRFDRLRRDEFELEDTQYERLRGEVARWREQMIELARRQERARDLGEGRGPNSDMSSERGGGDRTELVRTRTNASNVTVRAHRVPPPVHPREREKLK
jgi:hypothetical protein